MTEFEILRYLEHRGGSAKIIPMLNACPKRKLNITDNRIQSMEKRKLLTSSDVPEKRLMLTDTGYARYDELRCRISESVRWGFTTSLAVAAFVKSFFC